MPKSKETIARENRQLRRMVKTADSIMAYCRGDAWEREATEKDRLKFRKAYKQVFDAECET